MPNWVWNTFTVNGETGELNKFIEQAGQPAQFRDEGEAISPLSFWNFLKPSDDILGEYWGEEPKPASLAEAIQHKTNFWYDWNIRNWGCKWDARDARVDRKSDTQVVYTFDTAWSPPLEWFHEVVAQFPALGFELYYVEEQGWGGEEHGHGGSWWIVDEWEIPETHEETMHRRGYCYCEENDDTEYMYEDCPKRKELANA